MEPALAAIVFVVGALVSLTTSWVLVTRIERVGERLGFSEALLGIVLTQVCWRHVVVDQRDIETAAAKVVLYDPHVIAERVVVGLSRLAGRIGDVCDDAPRINAGSRPAPPPRAYGRG